MPARVFDSIDGTSETRYLDWLAAHPDGRVLNIRRQPDPTYAVLHRATCWTISRATQQTDGAPFTGRAYIKACATMEVDLLAWLDARQQGGFSKRCAICAP